MAAYRNAGMINSPNTNNNNNSNPHQQHMSATLNRDGYDYPSTKYNQSQNYKSVTMPKSHYQTTNATPSSAGREYVPRDDGGSYLASSSVYENESNSTLNEPSKRMQNPNGKFSIQKMIRQGFSSWRTRKKPSSASSSSSTPPPSTMGATNTTRTDSSTPPPSSSSSSQPPPLSTGRYVTNNSTDDLTQIPPPTAVRSVSVDSISNNITPKRIIVTEPVNFTPARASSVDSVTVDFDRPPTAATRTAYTSSPWTGSSTSTTTTTNTPAAASPIPTESMSQPAPVPTTRVLPVQFTGNSKIPVPRATPPPPPPSSSSFISPTQRPPSAQNKPIETINSTTPVTNTSTNSTRIPPPGTTLLSHPKYAFVLLLFQWHPNLISIV